uniref:ABC transporter ATP-binding protein n=1 Tax=uncultured Caulobacter sp. TaxID=158749 RepID=UPI0025E427B3|nr:ABC transporter ATP-binding protein [uncultured Caulobacter sp.]
MPGSVELRSVSKSYGAREALRVAALSSVDLSVAPGEFVAILGRSGSGKSTLLNMIAGLDRPDRGQIVVDGQPLADLSEEGLAGWRGRFVGVVFQFFQLVPTLTVEENILLAMDLVGAIPQRERRARAAALLDQVGIIEQARKLPGMLSGGQQQRAAIARAMANAPAMLVADEPTGNLDSAAAAKILGLLETLARDGTTVFMVTHDETVADRAHRLVRLADGHVVENRARGQGAAQ